MNINLKDMPDSPIDGIKFHKLQRLLDVDFVPALESFITQAQIYCNAIHAALTEDRIRDAMDIAHKLKSSSGLYGFWKVSKLSHEIEHARMTAGTEYLLALQSTLNEALQEAVIALEEWR